MSESKACSACGSETTEGALGTVGDTSLFLREAQAKTFAGMQVVRSSGPGPPVSAVRCSRCGRIELWA